MKAATLSTLRYINREDLIIKEAALAFEQISDYVRSLYPQFNEDDIESVSLLAMKLAIS